MDTPEIASTSKKPLLPLSSAKKLTSKTHALPEKKSTKGTLPQIKVTTTKPEIIYADRWNFRSLVQRLTGRSAKDTDRESDQLVLKVSKKSKWYEDMYNCISSLKMLECSVNVSQECLDCLVYCSLFPKDYEIDRDTLFQLWIAEGLIKEEPMEDIASSYLKALCDRGKCISLLREYYSTGKVWYKVNSFQIPEKVLQNSKITPVRLLISDDPASVLSVTETEHFHVALQRLLPKDLHVLGRFSKIRTLLLLRNHKANNVERIPYDFFMSLQNLRALDLSRTKVSDLPSSIGNAKCLRYLDLSETLVKRLPETIEFLLNLQTLKLRNCPRLIALPKAIRRLICLRHLDLGTLRRLNSMPTGMGALSCLRTLSEFVAGRENGCRITELGNMNDLGGKLCLSKLENVASLDDAKEANLRNKQRLKNLELRWTDDDDEHQESIGVKYENEEEEEEEEEEEITEEETGKKKNSDEEEDH
ncbi:putative disease resistance RPP13-like protein 1 [Spinacia oleracea]|uniref:Disease resistance RPP13-like protein 1 n=1 Tax=Spinacia oleracea TaxID=3562 RepID=A0ABM3QXX6_SPIOL|nr:putative disease resistance RPP13-like protein 1 [Spinacia oleracea]